MSEPTATATSNTSASGKGWIEVLQVISVLAGGAAVAMALTGAGDAIVWVLMAVIGIGSGVWAFLQIRVPPDIAEDTAKYVVTARRLRTLEAMNLPPDVVETARELIEFSGTAVDLRKRLYDILGEQRGNEYLPTLLSCFRVYVEDVTPTEEETSARAVVLEQKTISGG